MSSSQTKDTRTCLECGAALPGEAKYCWLCGRALVPGAPARAHGLSGCLGAAATALGVVVVLVALFIIWVAAMVIAAFNTCMEPCSH